MKMSLRMGRRKRDITGGRGFTLVETVIGLLLITAIATGVLSVVLYAQRASVSGEDRLAAMLALETKFIGFKNKTDNSFNVSQAEFSDPTSLGCSSTIGSECPDCPQYGQISNHEFKRTRCFYYKVKGLDTSLGMPTSLKKVSGEVYWEDMSGFKRSVALETVMTVS